MGRGGIRYGFPMSPRSRKVGGLDDPIWTGPGPDEGTSDPQAEPPGHQAGEQPAAWDPGGGNATGRSGERSAGRAAAPGDRRAARRPHNGGRSGTRSGSGRNGGGSGGATDIPRRILTDDPGNAGDDERECEAEGWFQTDEGVPVSSAFRPLGVACARPAGHPGHHRSAPRRARFHRGRVWVYEWGATWGDGGDRGDGGDGGRRGRRGRRGRPGRPTATEGSLTAGRRSRFARAVGGMIFRWPTGSARPRYRAPCSGAARSGRRQNGCGSCPTAAWT